MSWILYIIPALIALRRSKIWLVQKMGDKKRPLPTEPSMEAIFMKKLASWVVKEVLQGALPLTLIWQKLLAQKEERLVGEE
jgi:hypothetical protein